MPPIWPCAGAVRGLGVLTPTFCLVDGNRPIPELGIPQETIVQGDKQCFLIAAASIVAKVVRDRFMEDYHEMFPQYGFNRNKGLSHSANTAGPLRSMDCAPSIA